MRRLGYTLPEASSLGFTTDDLIALAISNDDLLRERNYVVQCRCKDLLSAVCTTRDELNMWMPSELFRLGFSREELVSKYGFSVQDISCDAFRQYYDSDGWKESSVASVRGGVSSRSIRIAGPVDVKDLKDTIKIDMKMLGLK